MIFVYVYARADISGNMNARRNYRFLGNKAWIFWLELGLVCQELIILREDIYY